MFENYIWKWIITIFQNMVHPNAVVENTSIVEHTSRLGKTAFRFGGWLTSVSLNQQRIKRNHNNTHLTQITHATRQIMYSLVNSFSAFFSRAPGGYSIYKHNNPSSPMTMTTVLVILLIENVNTGDMARPRCGTKLHEYFVIYFYYNFISHTQTHRRARAIAWRL